MSFGASYGRHSKRRMERHKECRTGCRTGRRPRATRLPSVAVSRGRVSRLATICHCLHRGRRRPVRGEPTHPSDAARGRRVRQWLWVVGGVLKMGVQLLLEMFPCDSVGYEPECKRGDRMRDRGSDDAMCTYDNN